MSAARQLAAQVEQRLLAHEGVFEGQPWYAPGSPLRTAEITATRCNSILLNAIAPCLMRRHFHVAVKGDRIMELRHSFPPPSTKLNSVDHSDESKEPSASEKTRRCAFSCWKPTRQLPESIRDCPRILIVEVVPQQCGRQSSRRESWRRGCTGGYGKQISPLPSTRMQGRTRNFAVGLVKSQSCLSVLRREGN